MSNPTAPRDEGQERFGARLRMQREARALSIADVVKITKIPERSLLLLEAGAFKDLPAEVFVRGFLKSYCRSVGLDAGEVLREYEELCATSSPRRGEQPSLTKPAPPSGRLMSEQHHPVRAAQPVAGQDQPPAAPAAPGEAGEPQAAAAQDEKEEISVFDALARAGRSTSRASLTVAVIILVIVATLTLSLLLRRPGHAGDGLSRRGSPPPAALAAASPPA